MESTVDSYEKKNTICIYLKLHLLSQVVTLCFTYADDDDDLQTGAVDGWVLLSLVSM